MGEARGLAWAMVFAAALAGCASGGEGAGGEVPDDGAGDRDAAGLDAQDARGLFQDASLGDASVGAEASLDATSAVDSLAPETSAVDSSGDERAAREAGEKDSAGDAPADAGCTSDTGCPLGETCNPSGECVPGCDPGHGCPSGQSCCGTTCIASTTCCSATDCDTPPTPTACYPAEGTCPSVGGTCDYAQNAGSVICGGSTCCNPINGTCNGDCSLDCTGGWGHCTGDPSKGCETDTNTSTANCGACGRACSDSNVRGLTCASGLCDSTCVAGWGNCNEPAAPAADDGCESDIKTCVGTPCCATGACKGEHEDGLGQKYEDCALFGVPGEPSTYTVTMAKEARAAWTGTGKSTSGTCADATGLECDCLAVEGSQNAVWCYTGTLAGYVKTSQSATPECPDATGRTWD